MTTAAMAIASPRVVKIVRTGRCKTFLTIRVMNRTRSALVRPRECGLSRVRGRRGHSRRPARLFRTESHSRTRPAIALHVEIAMAFDHVGERITEVHQVRDDPAVEAGNPQFVAEHAVGQVGHLVGDDDRRARASDPDHLAQGAFGIVEVVEGADAQDGVELAALERQLFGLALGQPDRAGRPRGGGRPRAGSARCRRRRSRQSRGSQSR